MACLGSNLTDMLRLAEFRSERLLSFFWRGVEALSLLAIACLPFFPQVARKLSVAAVLIWLALKAAEKGPFFAVPRVVWVNYAAFLFLIGLSIAARPPDAGGTQGLWWYLKWGNYFGIFFMAADMFREPARRSRFLFVFQITMIAVCLNGVYRMAYATPQTEGHSAEVLGRSFRMRGPFSWPNSLSVFLLFAVPVAFSEWFGEKRWSLKAALKVGVLILFSTCLILTFSRSAFLALFAATAVMLASKKAWRFLSLAGLSAGLFYLSSPVMRRNFFDSLSWKNVSVGERLSFWKGAWGMITAHPFRGSGIGMSPHLQGLYATVPRSDLTHNAYLQIAAEVGVPALILFLIPVFFLTIRGARRAGSVRDWAVWTGCLAFLFQAVVESSFYYVQPAILFWMFWGLSTASQTHEA